MNAVIMKGLRTIGRWGVKNAPKLCFGGGAIGFVTTIGVTLKVAPEIDSIIKEYKPLIKQNYEMGKTGKAMVTYEDYDGKLCEGEMTIEDVNEKMGTSITQEDMQKAFWGDTLRMTKEIVKAGWPILAAATASLGLFGMGFNILYKRYTTTVVALNSALTTIDMYREYRNRVIEDQGAEKDYYYWTGKKPETVDVVNEDGTVDRIIVDDGVKDDDLPFGAFYFDSKCKCFDKHQGYNDGFIKIAQTELTQQLNERGWLTLNDIRMWFGRTDLCDAPGQRIGYLAGYTTDIVDLGLYDECNRRAVVFDDGEKHKGHRVQYIIQPKGMKEVLTKMPEYL